MFHIVLYEPEIPHNTGAIIRLCANSGTQLHLIEPLGFDLSDKNLKRAGLDYHEYTRVLSHPNLDSCLKKISANKVYALSTKGQSNYADTKFSSEDVFLFGPETRGLPDPILKRTDLSVLRIPMIESSRSINLANATAIILYEAWRQNGFDFSC